MRNQSLLVLFLIGIAFLSPKWGFAQWWTLQKMHSIVNNPVTDELRPILSQDGKTMFFTKQGSPFFNRTLIEDGVDLSQTLDKTAYQQKLSEVYQSLSGEKILQPHLSSFNQDIWFLEEGESGFMAVNHLPAPINNAFPNSMCALSRDGKEAILVNQFPESGGIKKGFSIIQKRKDGNWSDPFPMTIKGLGKIEPDVNVALSDDAQYLVLSFQRHDSYSQSNDLYISKRIDETTWDQPMHLGPAINSPYHETAPFLSADGSKLFFSSNRRGGYGGSDIYYVERIGSGWKNWTAPQVLHEPINSRADESHPFFVVKTGELFFSSKRDGSSDIFKIQIAPKESNLVEIAGTVRERGGKIPVKAIVVSKPAGSKFLREVVETQNGAFSMKIPKGKPYEIQAQKNGYLSSTHKVNFDSRHVFFNAIPMDFEMEIAEEGHSFVLNNIQFKKSTPELLSSSHLALNELSEILSKHKYLSIEIVGHTDNQGPKDELFLLSKERALAIKNFLVVQKGIDAHRLKTKGVGDNEPLNLNRDEMERSVNRRVEIKIIGGQNPLTSGSK